MMKLTHNKSRAVKLIFALALTLTVALLAAMPTVLASGIEVNLSGDLAEQANASSGAITYDAASLTITVSKNVTNVSFTGTSTTLKGIVVESDFKGTIGLNGAKITSSSHALDITPGAEVTLALSGNNTLSPSFSSSGCGVHVPEGASVTINGSGSLDASGGYNCAAIGGADQETAGIIIINSGTLTGKAGHYGAYIGGGSKGNGGTITINGGTFTIKADDSGAAIGGGNDGNGGNITINGGTFESVVAGSWASAIGGGGARGNGGIITITGGTFKSIQGGASGGAAIGGGNYGSGGKITITGGTFDHIIGGSGSAGIGGGNYGGNGGDITISGGTLNIIGGTNAPGIGGGYGNASAGGTSGKITISGGDITVQGGTGAVAAIGGAKGSGTNKVGDTSKVAISGENTEVTIKGITASCAGIGSNGTTGSLTIDGGATVNFEGDTNSTNAIKIPEDATTLNNCEITGNAAGDKKGLQLSTLNATYGDTLSDITLVTLTSPQILVWDMDGTTSVGNVGTNTFTALYKADASSADTAEKVQVEITVSPKALTVTGVTAKNKTYDGNTSATLDITNAQLVGVVGEDKDNVALNAENATATFVDAAIGDNKQLTITDLALNGAQASNYFLTQPTDVTANITEGTATTPPTATAPPTPKPQSTNAWDGLVTTSQPTATIPAESDDWLSPQTGDVTRGGDSMALLISAMLVAGLGIALGLKKRKA